MPSLEQLWLHQPTNYKILVIRILKQTLRSKKYVDNAPFVKTDGSTPLTANLNMANNSIQHLADPVAKTDAANKKYTDAAHLSFSGHRPNPFKYLMDDDDDESSSENNITVTGISRFTTSPHPINRNAYLFTLTKEGAIFTHSPLVTTHSLSNTTLRKCKMSLCTPARTLRQSRNSPPKLSQLVDRWWLGT